MTRRLPLLVLVIGVLGACSAGALPTTTPGPVVTGSAPPSQVAAYSPSGSATPPASQGVTAPASGRPSSPAVISIVSPTNDATVTGSSVHVVISLEHAVIVQATTTTLDPGQGHIHLYVDGSLVSMNYSLEQDLPVTPGTYQLKAEFVASDHAPFNPRVWSQVVVFTVH